MKVARSIGRSVPLVFALVTITAYGLLLPLTGFYWDDWPFAWIGRFLGPAAFIPAFQGFRPFLAPIFYLTTSVMPASPLAWQMLALVLRFVTGMAAWFALRQAWPDKPHFTLWASLLFLVFPGYSQHWVAFTHINQEWISLIAYLLSFGMGIRAARQSKPSKRIIAAALLLQCIGLLPTEYFLGLEALRFFFLWAVVAESESRPAARLRTALRAWRPYLVVWILNAAWLAYFYWSGAYISYGLNAAASVPSPLGFAAIFADALWKAGIFAWLQLLPLVWRSLASPTSLLTLGLVAVAFPLLAWFLLRQMRAVRSPNPDPAGGQHLSTDEPRRDWGFARLVLLTGVTGILLGRVPSFAAGLPLTLQSSFDRLMISMMLGGSLLAAGLVESLGTRARTKALMIAGLVSLGIGQQFFNANIFRRDWQRQQEIYWQLAWRIPALVPDTAILVLQMPLDYETDLSMTAAVNWMYADKVEEPDLPYAVVYTEKRLGGAVLPALAAGTPISLQLRTMEFKGDTSRALVIYVPANGCLRVFDPGYDDALTYSRFPEPLIAPIPLSDTSRILLEDQPRVLPSPPFSPEPTHGWCYFYERAELARQAGDWGEIAALAAESSTMGLETADPFEWLPFIEAEARLGEASRARLMTREALQRETRLRRGLCALWERVGTSGADDSKATAAAMRAELDCSQ